MKIPVGSSNMLFAGFGTQSLWELRVLRGNTLWLDRLFKEEWVIKTT